MRDQDEVRGVAATVVLRIPESREMTCDHVISGARHQRGEAVRGNDPPDDAHPLDRGVALEKQRRL
jgi:hypothetical protein